MSNFLGRLTARHAEGALSPIVPRAVSRFETMSAPVPEAADVEIPIAASATRLADARARVAAPVRESPAGTGASDTPSHTTEALAQEVETLRKQLQSVQQQLDSQTTRQDSQKRKTTPPLKPQQTAP